MGKGSKPPPPTVTNVSTQTKAQKDVLNQLLRELGPGLGQSIQQFTEPTDYSQVFQQSVVDPSLLAYERQILPTIQERFLDANAGSSSALNQALAQSAADLSTSIGSQAGQFYQNERTNQMNALGLNSQLIASLLGQKTFEPVIQQQQSLTGPLIGAAGSIGGSLLGGPIGAGIGKMFG